MTDIDRLRLAIDKWGQALIMEIQWLREAIVAQNISICESCANNPCNKKAMLGDRRIYECTLYERAEQTEPNCETCIHYGVEFLEDDSIDTCLANECHYEPKQTEPKFDKDINVRSKTEPQIFICPIQDDYEALIEDEPQTKMPCYGCEFSKPKYMEYECLRDSCKYEDELQTELVRVKYHCINCAENGSYKCSKCDGEMYYKYDKDEPQTYITEDRDTQILDAWQVHHRTSTTAVEDEPQTERRE